MGREGKGKREGKGEGKGGKGWDGTGRDGKGREGKGSEGKGETGRAAVANGVWGSGLRVHHRRAQGQGKKANATAARVSRSAEHPGNIHSYTRTPAHPCTRTPLPLLRGLSLQS